MFSHSHPKGKARSQGSQHLRTVLGEGTQWSGDIQAGADGLRVEGDVEGNILCQGEVMVTATGKVKGTVQARRLTVLGRVEGVLKVETCLEILESGRVEGEVELGTLIVDEGGMLQGTCVHRSAVPTEKEAPPLAPRRDDRYAELPPPVRTFDKSRF
jgi:cytoskeletal protein CcmA (bactofilin family)